MSRYERFCGNFSNFAAKQPLTMEQKFGKNSIDIEMLREFCEREGKEVTYHKGDQLEREGDPARWFGFVTEGCSGWSSRLVPPFPTTLLRWRS